MKFWTLVIIVGIIFADVGDSKPEDRVLKDIYDASENKKVNDGSIRQGMKNMEALFVSTDEYDHANGSRSKRPDCGCVDDGTTLEFGYNFRYRVQIQFALGMFTEIFLRDWTRWVDDVINNRPHVSQYSSAANTLSNWGSLKLKKVDYDMVYASWSFDWANNENGRREYHKTDGMYQHRFNEHPYVKNSAYWTISRTPQYYKQEFRRFARLIDRSDPEYFVVSELSESNLEGSVTDPNYKMNMRMPDFGWHTTIEKLAGVIKGIANSNPPFPPERRLLIAAFGDDNCSWCHLGNWNNNQALDFIRKVINYDFTDPKMWRKVTEVEIRKKFLKMWPGEDYDNLQVNSSDESLFLEKQHVCEHPQGVWTGHRQHADSPTHTRNVLLGPYLPRRRRNSPKPKGLGRKE